MRRKEGCLLPGHSSPENEIDGADEGPSGPHKIKAGLLPHAEEGQWHEDGRGDDFLENLELGKADPALKTDAVGRCLKQACHQGDAAAEQGGNPSGFILPILEVGKPCEAHENIRNQGQRSGGGKRRHGGRGVAPVRQGTYAMR